MNYESCDICGVALQTCDGTEVSRWPSFKSNTTPSHTTPDMTNLTESPEPRRGRTSRTSSATAGDALRSGSASDPQQELRWKEALKNFEYLMEIYKERARRGTVSDQDVEQVVKAMKRVADSHTDPQVKEDWRRKAEKFREGTGEDRDGVLEEIGKGFAKLLITPFLLAGAALFAVGEIVGGVGSILKGFGRLTRKLTNIDSSESSHTTTG